MDKITFAQPTDLSLAPRKEIHFDKGNGTEPYIKGYPQGVVWWIFREVEITSLQDLAKALYSHANHKFPFCAVRGERIHADDLLAKRRAFDASCFGDEVGLRPMHRRWICLDVDKDFVQGDLSTESGCRRAAEELASYLPKSLHGCESIVHFSSTSNHDKVKGHIWLWLPKPVCDESLRAWAREKFLSDGERVFDASLYSPNQPHYIADPLVIGEPYPSWKIAKRWHFLKGDTITPERMPMDWMDAYEWIMEEKRISQIETEQRIASFKPKPMGKERAYADATALGLANDILRVQGMEGQRHETVRAAAMRAIKLVEEGVLKDYHLDQIKEAAYCVIPKNRQRDVERLFDAERIYRRQTTVREVPLKKVKVPRIQQKEELLETQESQDVEIPKQFIPDEAIPAPLLITIDALSRKWKHATPFWSAVSGAKEEYEARIRHGMTKFEAMAELGRFLNIVRQGWDETDVPLLVQLFPFSVGREGKHAR